MTQLNNDAQNAHIALDAMRNPTRGVAPDWTELQAYRDGGLTDARREEVLSHIANDAEVHQQWMDLAEAEHWLANPQNQTSGVAATLAEPRLTLRERFNAWLTPGRTALAGVGAMAVAAIAIVPSLVQQTALNAPSQFDMSAERYAAVAASLSTQAPRVRPTRNIGAVMPLTDNQVEKSYVLIGLRSVVEDVVKPDTDDWRVWLDNTPGDLPDCTGSTDSAYCASVAEDAQMLGQWTMLTWFGCRQQEAVPTGDEFWKSQTALWNTLRETHGFSADSAFAKELTALEHTGNIELCDRAERIKVLARSTN